ncbi:MAG: ribosome hibernation-promoting factor, HPF/YfiA family [Atopobiaceae bacterium]|jgi:putative sigma-54 modulation protein
MVDIKISGRRVSVTEPIRAKIETKLNDALKVFDIKPMTCDVVLRVDKNPANLDRKTVEVTVFVRDTVVRVEASNDDLYAAVDEAADKVTRQLRKYKTRVIDRRQRAKRPEPVVEHVDDLSELLEPLPEEEDDTLVREKYVDLQPMSVDEAIFKADLLGHDFYVFEDDETGLVNVLYHRKNGGYGIIKPKIESEDGQA